MSFADLVGAIDRVALDRLGSVPVVVYHPEVGEDVTVEGIFDAEYTLVEGEHAGVESRGPVVFLRLEDLPTDPSVGSPTVTIAGIDYQVVGRKPDGMGGILLMLHLVD